MEQGMQPKHALLSASSSHRWLNCTPSARLESKYEKRSTKWADEGTLAHAIAARELKQIIGLSTAEEDAEIKRGVAGVDAHRVEMEVSPYVMCVKEIYENAKEEDPGSRLLIERRLDFSPWVPEGFGTGDALIVRPRALDVVDLKFGKGVKVSAHDNPQLKLYALGALDELDYRYAFEEVTLHIVQPRIHNTSFWSIKAAELEEWAETIVAPLAAMALKGEGDVKAGEWCRFCKAKMDCAAHTYWSALNPSQRDFNDLEFIIK